MLAGGRVLFFGGELHCHSGPAGRIRKRQFAALVASDDSLVVLACPPDLRLIFKGFVGIHQGFVAAADAAAARSPRLSAWGLESRSPRGREYGPSGSGMMLLRHVEGTVTISRRFTADGSMFDHAPHAEAWGYALCSLRERASWTPFRNGTMDNDGVADVGHYRGGRSGGIRRMARMSIRDDDGDSTAVTVNRP